MSVDVENNLDRGKKEYSIAELKADPAALKATCEDYRIQACKPDECCVKAERDALLKDSQRLSWLIHEGAYGLIDHDNYCVVENVDCLQEEIRQKIDKAMLINNRRY